MIYSVLTKKVSTLTYVYFVYERRYLRVYCIEVTGKNDQETASFF